MLKNTPRWATDADPPNEASLPRGLELPIDDPANTWAVFVRRAVAFYSPRGVHHWIIWNEPDISYGVYGYEWAGSIEDYYRLLKVAYLVIKAEDPEAHINLAGLTFWHDPDWLGDFLAVATTDLEGSAHGYFFDAVSLHIYFQTDTVDYIVNEARATLTAYGLSKPIWINETNASPDADPLWPLERPRWRVDLREQASFILQSYALGLAAEAERMAVYKWMDAGLPPGGEPFGLLRPDHSRRPAYTAFRLATRYYAGARAAHILRQPLWTQVTIDRGAYTTRVFWARTEVEATVSVAALSSQAVLIDQEGGVQPLDGSGGSYTLTLPGARCADEILGCIVGGPTLMLLEETLDGDAGAPTPEVSQPPPATATPRPTLPPSAAPPPTATSSPTATPTASATPTPSTSPSATPTPSATVTSSPTASPTATPSLTPSPTDTLTKTAHPPSATPGAMPLPPSATPMPAFLDEPGDASQLRILGGLTALAGLGVFVLWLAKRRGGRRLEKDR